MTEYIEREKVKEVIKDYGKGAIEDGQQTLDPVDDISLLHGAIDMIPSADVVEVVRCKDCKHAKLDLMEKGLAVCRRPVLKNGQLLPLNLETKYNDYCSYGELKGSERK